MLIQVSELLLVLVVLELELVVLVVWQMMMLLRQNGTLACRPT